MSTDTEQRLGLLLQQAVIEPPREITVESVRRRATRQRKSIASLSASTVAVVVAAIVVPISVLGNSHHSGTAVEAGLPGLVLGSLASGRLVIEDPTDPKSARTVTAAFGVPGFHQIADNAADGWVTNIGAPRGFYQVRIADVSRAGSVTTFGPALDRGAVTSLAVSPNGGELAVATYRRHGETQQALIRILPMPGHAGPRRTWTLNPKQVHEVQSLSWAPDNRHLTYIAGTNRGTGVSGRPITLDTRGRDRTAPTKSPWVRYQERLDGLIVQCNIDAASWIGTNGSFGIVEYCPPSRQAQFVRVNPVTGSAVGRSIGLPGSGCIGTKLHASLQGAVLISWCGQVYYLHGGDLKLLPGGLTDAAFPGQPPTS